MYRCERRPLFDLGRPLSLLPDLHRRRHHFRNDLRKGWVEAGREHNAVQRPRLTAGLEAAGIMVWPSEANFVLADLETTETANAADAFLRSRGIIVRKVGGYGLPQCLRVTVGTTEEVDLVIEAFTDFMRQSRG